MLSYQMESEKQLSWMSRRCDGRVPARRRISRRARNTRCGAANNPQFISSVGNPDPNGHVWYDVSSKAKCEIVEQATAALLRYLERLPFTTNTAWPMVRRCWSEAPARFDELDKRQAGAQIATRDSIATFD